MLTFIVVVFNLNQVNFVLVGFYFFTNKKENKATKKKQSCKATLILNNKQKKIRAHLTTESMQHIDIIFDAR
jgi:hypothetical protein